ncbi:MAG: DNA adenine methylase [Ignavibacteriaceae bacterium]|nr:DNA adenine methylase [Ignavibacteriaceae bacterium]
MRYYGAKTKLLPFIEQAVKKTGVNGTSNFVDLFAGTSAVGRHFKKLGYTVISNDTLEFSYAIAKTYIETNKEPTFKKLKSYLKLKDDNKILFEYLNKIKESKQGFIFENYSPNGGRKYFSDENALKIDTYRYLFEEWKNIGKITELEYYYLITSLLNGVNLVSNVSGTYAAYLKTWDKRALNTLKLEQIEIIPSENKNKVYKRDANELIKEIHPDILYLDPPYNNRQYASNYFILELIAEGWFDKKPTIYGETGMREYDHQKSKYCSKAGALNALEDLLLNSSKAQYIILSYNNEGVIPQSAIHQALSRIGAVETFTENHKRYRSINQTVKDPQLTLEFLFVVQPKKIVNKVNNLSGKEWLQNSFSIWRDLGKNEEERKLKHPAIFTIKLVSKLIDTFCKPSGGLILDCFAGSGTTLIAGLKKEKDVIGFDLSSEYKKQFIKRATQSYNINSYGLEDKYLIADSRHLSKKIELESVDLCITSPPYWDILNRQRTADLKESKNYSDKLEDLGNIESYDTFIDSLKSVIEEVSKVVKPKGYFIVNVMDLRKKDKFFPLHIDIARIAQETGFSFEDLIIWDRQQEYNNMRPLGYPFKFIVNKVHEYLLIFRKPLV